MEAFGAGDFLNFPLDIVHDIKNLWHDGSIQAAFSKLNSNQNIKEAFV